MDELIIAIDDRTRLIYHPRTKDVLQYVCIERYHGDEHWASLGLIDLESYVNIQDVCDAFDRLRKLLVLK